FTLQTLARSNRTRRVHCLPGVCMGVQGVDRQHGAPRSAPRVGRSHSDCRGSRSPAEKIACGLVAEHLAVTARDYARSVAPVSTLARIPKIAFFSSDCVHGPSQSMAAARWMARKSVARR